MEIKKRLSAVRDYFRIVKSIVKLIVGLEKMLADDAIMLYNNSTKDTSKAGYAA